MHIQDNQIIIALGVSIVVGVLALQLGVGLYKIRVSLVTRR